MKFVYCPSNSLPAESSLQEYKYLYCEEETHKIQRFPLCDNENVLVNIKRHIIIIMDIMNINNSYKTSTRRFSLRLSRAILLPLFISCSQHELTSDFLVKVSQC